MLKLRIACLISTAVGLYLGARLFDYVTAK